MGHHLVSISGWIVSTLFFLKTFWRSCGFAMSHARTKTFSRGLEKTVSICKATSQLSYVPLLAQFTMVDPVNFYSQIIMIIIIIIIYLFFFIIITVFIITI